MELLYNVLENYSAVVMVMLIASCLLLMIFTIITQAKISTINKRINKFMGPYDSKSTKSIEDMLTEYLNKVDSVSKNYNKVTSDIKTIFSRLEDCTQKIGIVRYNPFENVGGDLCFALAMLDEKNNGVVINSIYSREGCYTYAKKITTGKCETHTLSEEEKEALEIAVKMRSYTA